MSCIYLAFLGFDDALVSALKGLGDKIKNRLGHEVFLGNTVEIANILCRFTDKGKLDHGAPHIEEVMNQHLFVVLPSDRPEDETLFQFQIRIPAPPSGSSVSREFVSDLGDRIGRAVTKCEILRKTIYANYSSSPFLLPLRNFQSKEFRKLICGFKVAFELHESDKAASSALVDRTDSRLRAFRIPKRKVTQEKVYVDKLERVHKFGLYDLHGGDPRLSGDHEGWCVINGYFRFGCRINSQHHFDVYNADKSSMQGSLLYNCHDTEPYTCTKFRANVWSSDHNIEKEK